MQTIDVRQLAQKQNGDKIDLIDVRTPAEFREVHAVGAKNLPLDSAQLKELIANRNGSAEPLFVICKSGSRSTQACKKFLDAGASNVVSVEGGTSAWVDAGLPIVRGKKTMSLERQVRIAAGMITFVGAVTAMVTGNVYFAGIPAFVGAGLTFAGVTDTCGMGMMLAKMPWNQAGNSGSCSV
jgi:rhodanese-related sulfurtransferase